jgi:hypothetical protein
MSTTINMSTTIKDLAEGTSISGVMIPQYSSDGDRHSLDCDRTTHYAAYPRTEHFKEDIIQAFYDGIKRKPETTFGKVKADVLADKNPQFQHQFLQRHPRFAVEGPRDPSDSPMWRDQFPR